MIKAIFFDIDGTILNSSGKVSIKTRQAIHQLQENGIKCFVASGRHLTEIESVAVNDILFDGYVTTNGQICLGKDRKMLMGVPISKRDSDALINIFEDKVDPCLIIQEDKMYINFVNNLVKKVQAAISTPAPPILDYKEGKIYQFCIYGSNSVLNKCFNQLHDCKMTKWNEYGADIISKNGGKVNGIKYFMNKYHLNQDEIMAFGDGENDIEMLQFASIGVAMGNADEAVKLVADYVTSSIYDEGVYNALRHFELI